MIPAQQLLPPERRHPADYRDEIEHAEVAGIVGDLPSVGVRMRNALALLAAVLVGACVTAEPMKTPSGRMGYVIACEDLEIEEC